jgi:hypothetical protein
MTSAPRPSSSATHRSLTRRPAYYYVPLPRLLLSKLRNLPLAIGVYAIVARVFRATKAVVPLSPADLCAYDPSLNESAAERALKRLVETGYLVIAPSGGRRNAYQPTWGPIKGASRPWDLADSSLGRPRHIFVEPLPQDLLDHYLGRLEPHARCGAHVARYITRPLLGLTDVGAYALAMVGYSVDRPALVSLGLLAEGQALPLPSMEDTLALVSQRRLFDAESPIALTPAGWARLGITPPLPATPKGSPLVFIPANSFSDRPCYPVGYPVTNAPESEQLSTAFRRPRGRAVPPPSGSHGSSCEKGSQNHHQAPARDSARVGGGSSASLPSAQPEPLSAKPVAPTTSDVAHPELSQSDAAIRLSQLGVRRDVIQTLADRPLAQVERVIAQARRCQGVRDIAAWVVGALRALPAEEPAAPPPPPKVSDLAILIHRGLTNAERTRWLTRFRNADLIDRPAVLSRFLQEHPRDTVA